MPITQASCPSCGAQITFKIGDSLVVVCRYCHSVVARTDRAVEDLGKAGELIETDSPLTIGLKGRYRGIAFELTGRTQLAHSAGGIWNEWYAAFADGRWGWLAEAQGRFYLTFEKSEMSADEVPEFNRLELGLPVTGLKTQVLFVTAEKGEARGVAAEGEIPWRFEPQSTYLYADLSAPGGKFGTIDYSAAPPLVFLGQEVSLADLGLAAAAPVVKERQVQALTVACSACGGPLALRAPDQTERVICPNCDSVHDVRQGTLKYLQSLKQKKVTPKIPLGATGELEGHTFTVVGFMQRSVKFDQKYYWEEYLLYQPQIGFRWLVSSDDHWSFVEPVSPGDIEESKKSLSYRGRRFKKFQDAPAEVECVYGEFYWKVLAGEKVQAVDFVAPPYMISKEVSRSVSSEGNTQTGEINYSLGTYLRRNEVAQAFKLEHLPRPSTVAPNQPFLHKDVYRYWLMLLGVALLLGIVVMVTAPRQIVFSQAYTFTPLPSADGSHVVFTDPFKLDARRNLRITAAAPVDNSWVYVEGDLINEATGLVQPFSLPIEYYYGVDGGERWSEGSANQVVYLAALPAGNYTLRLESQWQQWQRPMQVTIRLEQGVPRLLHILLALAGISLIPIFILIWQLSFEHKRWADSEFNPYGS